MIQKFSFEDTQIKGLKIIHPMITQDERGYFMKCYKKDVFEQNKLFIESFEEYISQSKKGVLRGLHFQMRNPQDKLIRVVKGEIYDVGVDLRKNSETFGKWQGFYLSENNRKLLYLPKGFAHGFLALSDEVIISCICGDRYSPETDSGIIWNDKDINIQWPFETIDNVILSERDKQLKTFKYFKDTFGGF